MIRGWVVCCIAAVLVSAPVSAEETEAALALKKLQDEFQSSSLGYEERAEKFKPRYRELAEKYKGSEEAVTALFWLLQQCWWEREAGTMSESAGKIADEILAKYPKSKKLATMAEYDYVFSAEQKSAYVQKVLAITPHESVKAACHYASARLLNRAKDTESKVKAQETFKLLKKDYADIAYRYSTYGEIADAHLNKHDVSALAIGQKAPEIIGNDVDGNPMKLSEYLGKVVVLDFWGDW